jgi:hypothetical protein
VKQAASLIAQKLKLIIEAEDHHLLRSKHRAITALLPFAVLQERDGQSEMLDTFLCAARASRTKWFTWHRIKQYASRLLHTATPRAMVPVLPYIRWDWLENREDLVQRWAAAVATVQYTQIASEHELLPHIPVNTWSWLTKTPCLPPICLGRYVGVDIYIVEAVRALKDIKILKSYFLLVWSEWTPVLDRDIREMCATIRGDFSGSDMECHRADLVRRLDCVIEQLDRGFEYFMQYDSDLREEDLEFRWLQWGKLNELLQEADMKAVGRAYRLTIPLLHALTPAPGVHRISCNVYVFAPSSMSITSQTRQNRVNNDHWWAGCVRVKRKQLSP